MCEFLAGAAIGAILGLWFAAALRANDDRSGRRK